MEKHLLDLDIVSIKKLLDNGYRINSHLNESTETALKYISRYHYSHIRDSQKEDLLTNICKLLVYYKANVNNCLPRACTKRNKDFIQCLIDNKADVNKAEGGDWMPLIWACSCKNVDAVSTLLMHNADVNCLQNDTTPLNSVLCSQIDEDQYNIVKMLLEKKADVNDNRIKTKPIWNTVRNQDCKSVNLLLEHKADINIMVEKDKSLFEMVIDNINGRIRSDLYGYSLKPLEKEDHIKNYIQIAKLLIKNGILVSEDQYNLIKNEELISFLKEILMTGMLNFIPKVLCDVTANYFIYKN